MKSEIQIGGEKKFEPPTHFFWLREILISEIKHASEQEQVYLQYQEQLRKEHYETNKHAVDNRPYTYGMNYG